MYGPIGERASMREGVLDAAKKAHEQNEAQSVLRKSLLTETRQYSIPEDAFYEWGIRLRSANKFLRLVESGQLTVDALTVHCRCCTECRAYAQVHRLLRWKSSVFENGRGGENHMAEGCSRLA